MIKLIYKNDSIECIVNGLKTSLIFLLRGLRQGCSLSCMLFNIYISELGHVLAASNLGFPMTRSLNLSGLLFADDIGNIALTAENLNKQLNLVNKYCESLRLEIGISKSQVVSPDDESWEIELASGETVSLLQVAHYKYLGVDTYSSVYSTCCAKQNKCIQTARKYLFGIIHLLARNPSLLSVAGTTWTAVALPTILFGCEIITFAETNIQTLDSIQAQVAKRMLRVPINTFNVGAVCDVGFKPIRLQLYTRQLKFYFRALHLQQFRWLHMVLSEHLEGAWKSPYIDYICRLRAETGTYLDPPSLNDLVRSLQEWSLSEINESIRNHYAPGLTQVAAFTSQDYVFHHRFLGTIAGFRLGQSGLFQRYLNPRPSCPLCTVPCILSDWHIIISCSFLRRARISTGINMFITQCTLMNMDEEKIYSLFISGLNTSENPIDIDEYIARGKVLATLKSVCLSGCE